MDQAATEHGALIVGLLGLILAVLLNISLKIPKQTAPKIPPPRDYFVVEEIMDGRTFYQSFDHLDTAKAYTAELGWTNRTAVVRASSPEQAVKLAEKSDGVWIFEHHK